jgi:hypothetical protein
MNEKMFFIYFLVISYMHSTLTSCKVTKWVRIVQVQLCVFPKQRTCSRTFCIHYSFFTAKRYFYMKDGVIIVVNLFAWYQPTE